MARKVTLGFFLNVLTFVVLTTLAIISIWIGFLVSSGSIILWLIAAFIQYEAVVLLISNSKKLITGENDSDYRKRIKIDREIRKRERWIRGSNNIFQLLRSSSFWDWELIIIIVLFIICGVVGWSSLKYDADVDLLQVIVYWIFAAFFACVAIIKITKKIKDGKIRIIKDSKNDDEILNFLTYRYKFLFPYLSIYGQLDINKMKKIGKYLNWESSDYFVDVDDDFGPWGFPEIKGISDNTSIKWSLELIDQFKDKWNWKHLSRNASLNWWSEHFITYFEDKWDWDELSNNINLNLNINLIEKFSTKWNWKCLNFHIDYHRINILEDMSVGICANRGNSWDYKKIDKFQDLIDWSAISLNPNIDFFSDIPTNKCVFGEPINGKYGSQYTLLNAFQNWNFENLSYNTSIGKVIKWESDKIVSEFLKSYDWDWSGISNNPSIPWTTNIIELLEDRLDWKSFSKNDVFANYGNGSFFWTIEFIEFYKDKLYWPSLSSNHSLPWSLDFIDHFINLWDWKSISYNYGITWSKEILYKYEKHLNWDILCESGVAWDKDLMREFNYKINWKKISNNKRVKWTLFMFRIYYSKLDLKMLFSIELDTPLTWEIYRYYLNDINNDSLVLLKNEHFCKKIIKPLLTEENMDVVIKEHLDRFEGQYREDDSKANCEKYRDQVQDINNSFYY